MLRECRGILYRMESERKAGLLLLGVCGDDARKIREDGGMFGDCRAGKIEFTCTVYHAVLGGVNGTANSENSFVGSKV